MGDQPHSDDTSAHLPAVLAGVPAMIAQLDLDWNIEHIHVPESGNASPVGASVFDFIAADDRPTAKAAFERAVRTFGPVTYTSRAPTKDGGSTIYENHVQPIIRSDQVVGLCVVGIDVAPRNLERKRHQDMQERYRFAIDATGLGVWSMDLRTGEGFWSDRMSEISGLKGPTAAEDFFQIVHPDDQASSVAAQERLLSDGEFQNRVRILVDGQVRWIQTHGRATFDENGAPIHIAGGMLDVTGEHEAQLRLRRAEKLEAVGQMTAGIAHNFNNMLMALLPSLELLADHVDEAGQEHLSAAREVTARAADIIRRLTAFASPDPATSGSAVLISQPVQAAVAIARRTFDKLVSVELDVAQDCVVSASTADVTQAVMNLLLNARDALADAERPDPQIRVQVTATHDAVGPDGAARPGAFGRIAVTDNGPGMPQHVLDRVFEPFFTTKGPNGSGLGLSTTYAIVRHLGGWMTVTSTVGAGTRLEILLPQAAATTPAPAPTTEPDDVEPDLAPVRVLIVDDEPLVRRVTERALTRAGFGVVAVGSVREARAVLETDSDFAVAIIDRSMPEAPGRSLVADVRTHAPHARIAFLTGDAMIGDERLLVDTVLAKPMTASELVGAVRRLISD